MEVLEKRQDNPSECINIWVKEIETSGFRTFGAYFDEDTENTGNDKNPDPNDNDEDAFVVEDPIGIVSSEEVTKYEREDGLDPNAGLKGMFIS